MNDVDFTGVRVLREVLSELDAQKISFAMARVGEHVRSSLSKGGLDDKITDANIYPVGGCGSERVPGSGQGPNSERRLAALCSLGAGAA